MLAYLGLGASVLVIATWTGPLLVELVGLPSADDIHPALPDGPEAMGSMADSLFWGNAGCISSTVFRDQDPKPPFLIAARMEARWRQAEAGIPTPSPGACESHAAEPKQCFKGLKERPLKGPLGLLMGLYETT